MRSGRYDFDEDDGKFHTSYSELSYPDTDWGVETVVVQNFYNWDTTIRTSAVRFGQARHHYWEDESLLTKQVPQIFHKTLKLEGIPLTLDNPELQLECQLDDDIVIHCTIDGYNKADKIVYDYKTTGSDNCYVAIPQQLLLYTWIARQNGLKVEKGNVFNRTMG